MLICSLFEFYVNFEEHVINHGTHYHSPSFIACVCVCICIMCTFIRKQYKCEFRESKYYCVDINQRSLMYLICSGVPPLVALVMAHAASFLVRNSAFCKISINTGKMLASITACNEKKHNASAPFTHHRKVSPNRCLTKL